MSQFETEAITSAKLSLKDISNSLIQIAVELKRMNDLKEQELGISRAIFDLSRKADDGKED